MRALSFPSPLGTLTAYEDGGCIVMLSFADSECAQSVTPLLQKTERELNEYFSGCRREFTLPLAPSGTEFQRGVWEALLHIPYGETASYRDIAARVGAPAACRAVGGANGKNPLPILIPCHRVIAADGTLGGYSGGLWRKEYLLELEKKHR